MSDATKAKEAADALVAAAVIAEERELAEALIEITEKYGKFNSDDTGVWAGYESARENDHIEQGVMCANCILYEGGTSCKIIAAEVEPGGYCRFALIPDGVVTKAIEDSFSKQDNAPVTAAILPEEREFADALVKITNKYGKFSNDNIGVYPEYESAEENSHISEGITCANCILYEGGTSCKILSIPVEANGYCNFAIIPDDLIVKEEAETEMEMSIDCPVCADSCTCSVGSCNCPPTCTCSCRGVVVVVSAASKPAPKKDRIYGSKKNKPGSASGNKKIVFSDKVETALKNKVKEHNEKASDGRKATLPMLKAVYRRGAGAFSSSHRPGKTRDQWAMARVNAYLKLLRTGKPSNPNYKQDNDLLPAKHPKSSRTEASTITASAAAVAELTVTILEEHEYYSPEHAILAMAEYSGLGYDVIPALRAAWLRGVNEREDPFERAKALAVYCYDNDRDSDLLPR
jgi:hypothetical protein